MLRATGKVLRALDKYCCRIISLSPFCVVSTQGPNGADISPRGDPPGFVHVLDDLTLLVPDRVGNNRLDTMTNLLVNPRISLMFLVPGINETLRVNGTGRITDDARLLATSAVKDRTPKVGISSRSKKRCFIAQRRWSDQRCGMGAGISIARSCPATRRCCLSTFKASPTRRTSVSRG